MTHSENESPRLKVRTKAGARLMSTGWVGICKVWFGHSEDKMETMEKRGPSRVSADEAEADAMQLLQDFNDNMMNQPSARYLGTDKEKREQN